MKGIKSILLCCIFTTICIVSTWAAEIVNIPDPGLEAALRGELGIPPPTPLTDEDLATLTVLGAPTRGIIDLTGLEYCVSMEQLSLVDNLISDIGPLAGLTNLQWQWLSFNQISNLQPLVDNSGLGTGDFVDVRWNPLSYKSINTDIPILQGRGVTVNFDDRIPTAPIIKVSGDGQTAKPGATLPNPLMVEVRDQAGMPFEGVPVTFTVTAGGGRLRNVDDATDANGQASARWRLGRRPGPNTVQVTAADIAEAVTFYAIAESGCPMTVISSDPAVHEELYEFRDSVLARNETGQWLTYFYYQHSPEVSDILVNNPMLAVRSAAILRDIIPGIRFLLNDRRGRDIIMTSLRVARIGGLFRDIAAQGSDDLAATLAELSEMLADYKGMRVSRIWELLR